jgi:hypothetical protein
MMYRVKPDTSCVLSAPLVSKRCFTMRRMPRRLASAVFWNDFVAILASECRRSSQTYVDAFELRFRIIL